MSAGETLTIDFSGVEGITASFADECVAKLILERDTGGHGARGYSVPNLYRMRTLAAAWPEGLSNRMRDLPWGHVAMLVSKLDRDEQEWYAERATGWSGAELEHHIASRLHERQATAITNFDQTLSADDAETVQRITRSR